MNHRMTPQETRDEIRKILMRAAQETARVTLSQLGNEFTPEQLQQLQADVVADGQFTAEVHRIADELVDEIQ